MEDVIFIDSNIWCYYFNKSSWEHKDVCLAVDQILSTGEIAINSVVIMEVAHYLFRQNPLQAEVLLDTFLSYPFHFFELDIKTVHHAIQILHQYTSFGIGGRDATIIASMEIFQIKYLMTNDNAFQHVKSIEVINPVQNR